MLTVWCVLVGDKYTEKDVYMLQGQIEAHLSIDFQFVCLSDRILPDCHTFLINPYPGWWSKLLLFRYATAGYHLYFDLDVVITGALDHLVSGDLSMPRNWARSGHGGWQSSVMAWGGDYSWIEESFHLEELSEPADGNYGYYGERRLWGDQEFITMLLPKSVYPMPNIYSYKYHCREQGSPPSDASVVCFHGNPKPDEVSDPWVTASRFTPMSTWNTKLDTQRRLNGDSLGTD